MKTEGFIAKSRVLGHKHPRIAPYRPENVDYTYGNAIINWAKETLEFDLLPWQEFLLREGCARRNDRFIYRTVCAVVARQNGKTTVATLRLLGGMCLFGEKTVLGAAQNRRLAVETWETIWGLAEAHGLGIGRLRRGMGSEEMYLNGARYRVVASSPGGARGMSGVDLVLMDEIRQQKSWDGYAALEKTRRAKPDSQLWAISTEGDHSSEVLNKLQTIGRDAIEAGVESPVGYFEWSAGPTMDAGVPETWAYANPALGYLLDEAVVASEFVTDPRNVFEVEVLCRKVAAIQTWVNVADWDSLTTREPFPTDKPFVIAVDAGPELRHVSIVAGASEAGRHHLETVETFAGPGALASAERRLEAVLRRWKPASAVVLAKSPVEASTRRIAANAGIPLTVVRLADWARGCRAFYAAVNQRTVKHPGGTPISLALAGTRRGVDGLVSSVHRVNATTDNDAAIAAILALWASSQEPAPTPNWTVY